MINDCKNKPMEGDKEVSVYLDCYDRLGHFGEPYWEIYPTLDGYAERFAMNDIDGLLKEIGESLDDIGGNE